MAIFKVKKGKTLPILGKPQSILNPLHKVSKFAFIPTNFEGVKFKLEVKEGDKVKVGTPLFE